MDTDNKQFTFHALRAANRARLPQFKNKHGEPAHTTTDGSDWTPAQWLQAVMGELGEYATVREQFELGEITFDVYRERAAKELADVATYLDLLAQRCLDVQVASDRPTPAQALQSLISRLGEYANRRKKFERGDLDTDEFLDGAEKDMLLIEGANVQLARRTRLMANSGLSVRIDPHGINLGSAVITKFNEVSERVGSSVFIDPLLTPPPAPDRWTTSEVRNTHTRGQAEWVLASAYDDLLEFATGA